MVVKGRLCEEHGDNLAYEVLAHVILSGVILIVGVKLVVDGSFETAMMRTIYAYLLWLPPLGWLGLHQCYLGRHYHAMCIFTTFAGFFLGWFRDVWRIPTYANMPTRMIEVEHVGCCGVCARVKSAIRNCFGRFGVDSNRGLPLSYLKRKMI